MSGLFPLVFVAATLVPAETHATANFIVDAPTPEIAAQVAVAAEQQRKQLSILWLGKEMQAWTVPMPIRVEITLGAPHGVSTFTFARQGGVETQKSTVSGPLDNILGNVLPHEMAHVILTHHFGRSFPRWADEGGAILAEGTAQHRKWDKNVTASIANGDVLRLRVLFGMTDYPKTSELLRSMYSQGQSVSRFLIETKGHAAFLAFIATGMSESWDAAVQAQYGDQSVEHLEQRWLRWVREQKVAGAQ